MRQKVEETPVNISGSAPTWERSKSRSLASLPPVITCVESGDQSAARTM